MNVKQDNHIFLGMQLDLGSIRQDAKFLRNALNIRLTARDNLIENQSNSSLIISNERGPLDLHIALLGKYLGHAVLNNHVTVFTTIPNSNKPDYIYRIDFNGDDKPKVVLLFNGDLNLSLDHPIEALADYELEDVLKVYWTDGYNPMRVINIMADEEKRSSWTENTFSFVLKLPLKEEVIVEKITGTSGQFTPGVIQYAFTYYNQYLQESNIFYTTPLYYISPPNRGGSPNETVANAFKITITNVSDSFDFIRIYAIQRSAINDTPLVRRVADISVKDSHDKSVKPRPVNKLKDLKGGWEQSFRDYGDSYKFLGLRLDSPLNLYKKNSSTGEYELQKWEKTWDIYIGTNDDTDEAFGVFYEENTVYKFIIDGKEYFYYPTEQEVLVIVKKEEGDFYVYLGTISIYKGSPHNNGDTTKYCLHLKSKLDLKLYALEKKNLLHTVSYIDNGTLGEAIEPQKLLFIGGEPVKAETMCQKDGTLFLGNLLTTRKLIMYGENLVNGSDRGNPFYSLSSIESDIYERESFERSINGDYSYYSSLNSSYSAGFKRGEWYRLGILFLHNTGKWSSPIWIGDARQTETPDFVEGTLTSPIFTYDMKNTIQTVIDSNPDYVKVRPLIVTPLEADRNILLQGIACPTLYTEQHRDIDKDCYAQSSWYIRAFDISGTKKQKQIAYDTNAGWDNDKKQYTGTVENIDGDVTPVSLRKVEVLGYYKKEDKYWIDESFITLHSPDLMFNLDLQHADYSKSNILISGSVDYTSIFKDVDIITKSGTISVKGQGFSHRSSVYKEEDFVIELDSIEYPNPNIGYAGLYFDDFMVCDWKKYSPNGDLAYYPWDLSYATSRHAMSSPVKWLVYPWHRNGSLNNDSNRLEANSGVRSAELDTKKMSSLFYGDTVFKDYSNPILTKDALVFASDVMQIIKVDGDAYQGNVDTLLAPSQYSSYYFSYGETREESSAYLYYETYINKIRNLNTEYHLIPALLAIADAYSSGGVYSGIGTLAGLLVRHLTDLIVAVAQEDFDNHRNSLFLNSEYIGNKGFWSATWSFSGITQTVDNIADWVIGLPYTDNGTSYTGNQQTVAALNQLRNLSSTLFIYISSNTVEASALLITSEEVKTPFEGVINGRIFYDGSDIKETQILYFNKYSPAYGGDHIGRTDNGVALNRSNVRIKYRSTPHLAIKLTDFLNPGYRYPILDLVRYQDDSERTATMFGGTSEDALRSHIWIPAGEPVLLEDLKSGDGKLKFIWGDTWYQRYDCLKTFAFTPEDPNQVIEIMSTMLESRVNLDGRYDRNRGQINNTQANPSIFNLMNSVYSQLDNFFNYTILSDTYYGNLKFANQVTWSVEKSPGADIDAWTDTTMATVHNMDGDKGSINALRTWQNQILCFQDKGLSILQFNNRVLIPTSDGTPIEISNNYKMEGKIYFADTTGCTNKYSIQNTPSGLYFIDSIGKQLCVTDGRNVQSLSDALNMSRWFTHLDNIKWLPEKFYIRTCYDSYNNDIYLLSEEVLGYSEKLKLFTSFYSYEKAITMFNVGNRFYSFIPSDDKTTILLYRMFSGDYNNYYSVFKPFYIEFVSNDNPTLSNIFTNIEMRGHLWKLDKDGTMADKISTDNLFDTVRVWHEYQDTGIVDLSLKKVTPSNLKNKKGIWRIDIPRQQDSLLERIQNTWTNIRLGVEKLDNLKDNQKIEIYDTLVDYYF